MRAGSISKGQKDRLFAMLGDRGVTEREHRLRFLSHAVGRPVGSTNELTGSEAHVVMLTLDGASDEQVQRWTA